MLHVNVVIPNSPIDRYFEMRIFAIRILLYVYRPKYLAIQKSPKKQNI